VQLAIDILGAYNAGHFLISQGTIRSSRRTLLKRVIKKKGFSKTNMPWLK
jgi:hypothetical protein